MYIAHASEIFYNKDRSGVGLIINLRHSSRAILLYIQLTSVPVHKVAHVQLPRYPASFIMKYKMIQKKNLGFPTSKVINSIRSRL